MTRNPKLKEFSKSCPKCGVEQFYSGKKNLQNAIRKNHVCLSCRSRVYRYPMYEEIPIYWVTLKQENAAIRNYEWNLTVEFIWELYIKQNKVCALSGVPIAFPDFGRKATASIDRIDSSKGYFVDNVQLVHKDVNRMKSIFTDEYFIEMCKKIAKNREQ